MNELKYKLRVPSPNQGSVSLLVNAKILKIQHVSRNTS